MDVTYNPCYFNFFFIFNLKHSFEDNNFVLLPFWWPLHYLRWVLFISCINRFTSLYKNLFNLLWDFSSTGTVKHWKWCTWYRKTSAKNSSKLNKFLHSEVNLLIQHIIVQDQDGQNIFSFIIFSNAYFILSWLIPFQVFLNDVKINRHNSLIINCSLCLFSYTYYI